MTAAIKGTFPVKQREHNGLERIAGRVNGDRLRRVYVVAVVEWHAHRETANDDVVTFNVAAIEPACDDDLNDTPETVALRNMLDKLRKQAGKANVADTLFADLAKSTELPGQTSIDDAASDKPEAVRDGRPVPPPSGEELTAELRERQAREAGNKVVEAAAAVATAANGGKSRPAKSTPAPVTFSPGGGGAA